MKQKVLALVMIVPLIFMIALFSVGKVASFFVDIPASGISITTQNQDGFIDVDIANYNNDIYLTANVEPANAKNKGYYFEVSGLEDEKQADIKIENDGRLVINSDGKAKITAVSVDKGFKDSIVVSAYSTKVLNVTPQIVDVMHNKLTLNKTESGYAVDMTTGEYEFSSLIYPDELSDSTIIWNSDNTNVLEINKVTGKAKAKLSGRANIILRCPNGINGDIYTNIEVNVSPIVSTSGLSINGLQDNTIMCSSLADKVEFLVEKTDDKQGGIVVGGSDKDDILSTKITQLNDTQYLVTLVLDSTHPSKMNLEVSISGYMSSKLWLNFEPHDIKIYTSYDKDGTGDINQRNNSKVLYAVESIPYEEGISYEWSVDGDVLDLDIKENTGLCSITARKLGSATITIKAYKNSIQVGESIQKVINVVKGIYSIDFVDNAVTYGIENLLTVGSESIKTNNYTTYRHELKVKMLTDSGIEYYEGSDLKFESDNNDVLRPFVTMNNFKVDAIGNGIASIKASWSYGDYFGTQLSSKIKIRAVNGGVVVDNYEDLRKATEDGKKVILNQDIMLGKENMSLEELKSQVKSLPTTFDWQFYANKGKEKPNVYYIIEFKNDIYGNGHMINADNFTQATDSTGMPLLFKGPLDFVAIHTASVKAQDNIVFLVRNDDVIIDNVDLKGCSDESLVGEQGFDLNKLNYTGTTLEIMSNCRLVNSRVSNGRTVVRSFGRVLLDQNPVVSDQKQINADKERIVVDIESCILSQAREFILKVGTNRAVLAQGNSEDTFEITQLLKPDGSPYEICDSRNAQNDDYYRNIVLTDVTLKNCVFKTSGLFSIGIETHFTGPMLSGFSSINPAYWSKLAATSMASIVKIEEDIKLLDWKKLDDVDSSTLIETTNNAQAFLTLDVSAMINKATTINTQYEEIIDKIEGVDYVHGGIVFYGGGFNYSCLDMTKCTSEKLGKYKVNLSILAQGENQNLDDPLYLQGTMLPQAAGTGDFVFFMYNKNSTNNYYLQQELDKIGFDIPVAKV